MLSDELWFCLFWNDVMRIVPRLPNESFNMYGNYFSSESWWFSDSLEVFCIIWLKHIDWGEQDINNAVYFNIWCDQIILHVFRISIVLQSWFSNIITHVFTGLLADVNYFLKTHETQTHIAWSTNPPHFNIIKN